MNLAETERPPYKLFETVTHESHSDPSMRPEPRGLPVNMPTPLELKTKNKDGMPYAILFEHSNNVPADVSYEGTRLLSICSIYLLYRNVFNL